MANEAVEAIDRLDVLIGNWKTDGLTTEGPGAPAQQVDAVDTYERLPGGALLHLVDALVGELKVEGAEIIGFDAARRSYLTQFFGGEDATAYRAVTGELDDQPNSCDRRVRGWADLVRLAVPRLIGMPPGRIGVAGPKSMATAGPAPPSGPDESRKRAPQ